MKEAGYEWDADKKELEKVEQKPAWSEEDKKMFVNIKACLRNATNKDYSAELNWLKSLKDRCTWKPSKEQMNAFDAVLVYNPPCSNECRNHLITLYNKLKKLREE